jgi:WS/DGAT/MGAT family acyltransferase
MAERLTGLDTAFFRLESAAAPMHLGAVAVFQPPKPIPPIRLISLLGERADALRLLHQRVAMTALPPGVPRWVDDPEFDARSHIQLHRLDAGGQKEVAATAARIMADPLDLDQPLWQLHVLTGLRRGGFAVLVKLHHAMADGLRALELGLGLLDGVPTAAPPTAAPTGCLSAMIRLAAEPYRLAGHAMAAAVRLPATVRQAAEITGAVLARARRSVPETPLAVGSPAGRRLALVCLPVADVREVRRRYGGTDHDVLLAILAGALRRWLQHRAHPVDELDVRALIPVSRRSGSRERQRGNVLSGYLCPLPVHEQDPLAQLRTLTTTMHDNKARGPRRGAGAFPLLAELMPDPVQRIIAPLARRSAGRLFDTVVTNVPLPHLKLTLHGAPLREVYPIVPLAYGHALGVALSPYRGTVHIGLHADAAALPDLDHLASAIPEALGDLRAAEPLRSAA